MKLAFAETLYDLSVSFRSRLLILLAFRPILSETPAPTSERSFFVLKEPLLADIFAKEFDQIFLPAPREMPPLIPTEESEREKPMFEPLDLLITLSCNVSTREEPFTSIARVSASI